ncbi:hypothetical protein ABRP77_01905 [Pectobacterium odoriferum]|uniref:hypothetical protein n=1 Tax=Pectobacterium odoriferum TaxID=78398 RepID=UPI0032EBFA24
MRLILRASSSAVQIGLEPICHAVAAFLRLELFRAYPRHVSSRVRAALKLFRRYSRRMSRAEEWVFRYSSFVTLLKTTQQESSAEKKDEKTRVQGASLILSNQVINEEIVL